MIRITIAVSVYNISRYLPECLNSIKNQSIPPYEVILVDDGSTDGSSMICDSYQEKSELFRVIHQNNQGISSARNTAIRNAKGEYIFFIDGDDWLDHRCIESYVELIKSYGHIDYIDFRLHEYFPQSDIISNYYVDNKWACGLNGKRVFAKYYKIHGIVKLGVKGIFNLEFLKNNDLYYDEELRYAEDTEFIPRVYYYAKEVVGNDFPGYCYRGFRSDSLTQTLNVQKGSAEICIYQKWNEWIVNRKESLQTEDDAIFFDSLSRMLGKRLSFTYKQYSEHVSSQSICDWIHVVNKNLNLRQYIRLSEFDSMLGKSMAVVCKYLPPCVFIRLFVWRSAVCRIFCKGSVYKEK